MRKGQDYTKAFMEEKCKLLFPPPWQGGDKKTASQQAGKGFGEITNFMSKLGAKEDVKKVFLRPKSFLFSLWGFRFVTVMFNAVAT